MEYALFPIDARFEPEKAIGLPRGSVNTLHDVPQRYIPIGPTETKSTVGPSMRSEDSGMHEFLKNFAEERLWNTECVRNIIQVDRSVGSRRREKECSLYGVRAGFTE
jgi:hypothetical protein